MSDILTRHFGPDPNPRGPLPNLPTGYGAAGPHIHTWTAREASGISYWECTANTSVCLATRTDPPEDT